MSTQRSSSLLSTKAAVSAVCGKNYSGLCGALGLATAVHVQALACLDSRLPSDWEQLLWSLMGMKRSESLRIAWDAKIIKAEKATAAAAVKAERE